MKDLNGHSQRSTTAIRWLVALVVSVLLIAPVVAIAQTMPPNGVESASPLRSRVIEDLRRRPVGRFTMDTLNMPEEYWGRIADRLIRASYEQQFRIVVRESKSGIVPVDSPINPISPTAGTNENHTEGKNSYIPIWIAAGVIIVSGLLVARRGEKSPT